MVVSVTILLSENQIFCAVESGVSLCLTVLAICVTLLIVVLLSGRVVQCMPGCS